MSIYMTGDLMVSAVQQKRITNYLKQTGQDPDQGKEPEQQRYVLSILAAFGECPQKAAEAYQEADHKSQAAMQAHYTKMMQSVPFPEKDNFYLKFHSIEEGEAYYEKIQQECLQVSRDVFQKEFYDKIEAFHQKEWDTPHGVQ